MIRLVLIMLISPMALSAQKELLGIWRLKESRSLQGPDYTNAIPLLMTITQEAKTINWVTIFNNGQEDTTISEFLVYKEDTMYESTASIGSGKRVLFRRADDGSGWLKQTEYFSIKDSGKPKSVNSETFTVYPDGKTLAIYRKYEGGKGVASGQDFTIWAAYEKLTQEQLDKEGSGGKGVSFVEDLKWEQIKAKAQKENKYIFVDCYATWCRPCKVMDKSVFALSTVGEIMNDQFIAVKVQMDTGKKDGAYTKAFYPLARKLEAEFQITALPTYLFFAPDGQPVHKAVGQQSEKAFIELLGAVKDPGNQLYTLVNKAKKGEFPLSTYPELARRLARTLGDRESAVEVAGIYYKEYLLKLGEEELLTKVNLDFIGQYQKVVRTSDRFFELCRLKPALVDSMKENKQGEWAQGIVDRTIKREDIDPVLQEAQKRGKEPDWKMLESKLTKKYGERWSVTHVLGERVEWYWGKEEWSSYLKVVKPFLSRLDLSKVNPLYVNSCAWYVFKYSNDKKLMKDALAWMDIIIEKSSNEFVHMLLDTKAFLLYKMGKKEEGIDFLKKALKDYPQQAVFFKSRLEVMTKGGDVWLNQRLN